MDTYANYYFGSALLLCGLIAIGVTNWIEYRRERRPMLDLMPTTPFMLLGVIAVLGSLIFFLTLIRSKYTSKYIAATALSFGLIVIAFTRWIEHHRLKNPNRYLSSTTPFMLFGAMAVLFAFALFVALLGGGSQPTSF
jgi:uncharacterized membrane protein YidH (DUF202 family)